MPFVVYPNNQQPTVYYLQREEDTIEPELSCKSLAER